MTTYDKLLNKYGYIYNPKCGINEDGENIIISIDKKCACVKTLQSNNWARTNIYYKDGTEEELYSR